MTDFEYLGPYKIGNVIGRGGMGSVYEGTHAKSGDHVAVKLIAQHVADDMRFRRRFDGEIETLRRLRHPGIVRLVGYGEAAGRLFYAMELVEGESLQKRIRDVKRMGWLPAIDIAIQICAALKHAHDIGVVHRDLKPANLLLTPANEVKLVDFGIAKLFGYGEQTVAGSVLGTADYMAPEQAGDGPITPRTDLYSLGSVMYAMMSGRSPFAGKKLTQVIESLKHDRAVPLDLINPDIPTEVVEIVHHLLQKDPKERPPTALAVMKRLKATRAGLQRGRTVALENELTRGGELAAPIESDTRNSSLTDAPRDNVSKAVPPLPPRDATGARHSGLVSPDGEITEASLLSEVAGESTNVALPPTQDSYANEQAGEQEFATGAMDTSSTRYRDVDGDDREGFAMGHSQATETPANLWLQTASVVGMVAILIGGVFLFVRSIQVPPADDVFTMIEQAEEDGDLTLHENRIEQFLANYPDDERVEQVRTWEEQAGLQRTLKRLSAAARRAGGVERLEPAAQSFLKVMALRESSAQAAQEQLIAWLNVFDPTPGVTEEPIAESPERPEDGTTPLEEIRRRIQKRETSKLARHARFELERLSQTKDTGFQIDERVTALEERLQFAETLTEASRKTLLEGIIKLYGKDPWAKTVVKKTKTMLDALSETNGSSHQFGDER